MKLPPRRVLRSVLQDAIDDRIEMLDCDPSQADALNILLARYRDLEPRLADAAPPLTEADVKTLRRACGHARIWREGLVDSWSGTEDKAQKLSVRQDLDRLEKLETALGIAKPDIDSYKSVSIFDIVANSGPDVPADVEEIMARSGGRNIFMPAATT